MGGRLWSQILWELRTMCFPGISLADGAGSWRWTLLLGALPLKMAFLSILKICPHVWTVSQGDFLEHCNQSLLSFIIFFVPFQVFFLFLSPYYSIWMWLHRSIGPDLCSLQLPVFEVFYEYLGLTVSEIYLLG
jgi:hypothetical protein